MRELNIYMKYKEVNIQVNFLDKWFSPLYLKQSHPRHYEGRDEKWQPTDEVKRNYKLQVEAYLL